MSGGARAGKALAAGSLATALILGSAGAGHATPGDAPAGADAVSAPNPNGLTVSPGRELFNVVLQPGDAVVAPAQIHNSTSVSLDVDLVPVLAHWVVDPHAVEALELSLSRSQLCDAATMRDAASVNMGAHDRLFVGAIGAGETVPVCIEVRYPAANAVAEHAISVVDFSFTAWERSGGNTGPGEVAVPGLLSQTGGGPGGLGWLRLTAIVLVVGGAIAAVRGATRVNRTQ